jgi:hypothetical protein
MTAEQFVEQLEKLVEEKIRQGTILTSKNLGDNKELFLNESRLKIEQIKKNLAQALSQSS